SKPGEEIKEHGCRECHMPDVVKDKAPKLKDALHHFCIECHDQARKDGNKDAPKKTCKACHTKKK
ncbi:MAG: hypothetical protein K8I02_00260, partial [Candidatus Methylomirabilis sp.]|nr:hypothetical protein [Deltaproteobacteria bacterium]